MLWFGCTVTYYIIITSQIEVIFIYFKHKELAFQI